MVSTISSDTEALLLYRSSDKICLDSKSSKNVSVSEQVGYQDPSVNFKKVEKSHIIWMALTEFDYKVLKQILYAFIFITC